MSDNHNHGKHSTEHPRSLRPAAAQESSAAAVALPKYSRTPSDEAHDVRHKRLQIAVACEVCRRRKAKCDGRRPVCGPCATRGHADCKYVADPDATRMTTLKRKYEVLSHSKRQLEELYDLLRDRSSEEADEILRRIRAGHSLGEILQTTQDGALLDRQDETTPMQLDDHGPSTQTVTLAQLRARHARAYYDFQPRRSSLSVRDRMKVDSLLACASAESPECELTVFSPDQRTARQQEAWSGYVDPTLNSSRLEEWTSVTDDNDLLKHLVSMFFAFESPQWMFFIREQFISDLVHQKTTFCSSMLFNSICAYACHISPRLSRRCDPNHFKNMGTCFWNEAQRQFETRSGEDDFLTVQTALLLTMTAMLDGEVYGGLTLCKATVEMANDLGLYNPNTAYKARQDATASQVRHVSQLTAWALFNYITFIYSSMRLDAPLREAPPFPPPALLRTNLNSVDAFKGYPLPPFIMDDFAKMSFLAYCALTPIQSQITSISFGGDSKRQGGHLSTETAAASLEKLFQWTANLPAPMTPFPDCPPHVLVLHMFLHSIIIDMLFPFRDRGDCIISIKDLPHPGCTVRDLLQASRQQVINALEQLKRTHGIERGPFIILQTFFVSIIDMRRHIHQPEIERYFLAVVQGMREVSNSYYAERLVLKDLRKTFRRENIQLSKDILDCITFDDDIVENAGVFLDGHADSVSSQHWDLGGRLAVMEALVDALSMRDMGCDKGKDKVAA